ncbi:hypothetical protein BJX61DRAFT_496944 [Aspergillus egyptiacus]|nr:hypothetical protein BJX61DRAFT_496944 [Aspergillus egyptiacus]
MSECIMDSGLTFGELGLVCVRSIAFIAASVTESVGVAGFFLQILLPRFTNTGRDL